MIGPALVALAADLLAGEPPTRIHPTVAMGRWIARGRAARRSRAPLPSLLEGAAVVAGGAFCAAALGLAADRVIGAQSTTLSLSVRNLFDRDYFEYTIGRPRSYYFDVGLRF